MLECDENGLPGFSSPASKKTTITIKKTPPPNRVIGIELHPGERMHCVLHSSAMPHGGELHDLRSGFHRAGRTQKKNPVFSDARTCRTWKRKKIHVRPSRVHPNPHNTHIQLPQTPLKGERGRGTGCAVVLGIKAVD
jgi:hypothetical protein